MVNLTDTNGISASNIYEVFKSFLYGVYLSAFWHRGNVPRVQGHIRGSEGTSEDIIRNSFVFFGGNGAVKPVDELPVMAGSLITAQVLYDFLVEQTRQLATVRYLRAIYMVRGTGGNTGTKNPVSYDPNRVNTVLFQQTQVAWLGTESYNQIVIPPTDSGIWPAISGANPEVNSTATHAQSRYAATLNSGWSLPIYNDNLTEETFRNNLLLFTPPLQPQARRPVKPTNLVTGSLIVKTDLELLFTRCADRLDYMQRHVTEYLRHVCHASCHNSCHGSRGRR